MIKHCEHVKTNGQFCGSPAMRGRNYCFYHLNVIGQRLRAQQKSARREHFLPELPQLEDAASIQLALMQVTEWLLRGVIEYKCAGLVLYALQTASLNLRQMQNESVPQPGVPICNRYDSFEQDYELQDVEHLRVEEPAAEQAEAAERARAAALNQSDANGAAEGESSASKEDDVLRLIADGERMGFLPTNGVCCPRSPRADGTVDDRGPRHLTDREFEDGKVRIPMNLTEMQYLQARDSIEQYQEQRGIDSEHPMGRKPHPQRAAISQKMFMGSRKPPGSVRWEEEEIATSN